MATTTTTKMPLLQLFLSFETKQKIVATSVLVRDLINISIYIY